MSEPGESGPGPTGMNRRAFFKIVATSGAAVAAAGCGKEAEELLGQAPTKLIPYVVPPDGIVPGVAAYFSTVCRECPSGCGLVAKNRDGRVIKLEGNPDHPVNAGALCIRGQAQLQGLYHPDRFRGAQSGGKAAAWDDVEKQAGDRIATLVKGRQGRRIALVSGLETGSLGRLMDEWTRALGARPRIAYEPLGYEALRAANRATFGRDAIPHYAIEEAGYLLSFGADFLETWINPVAYAGAFARMHALGRGRAGTFVHVEPRQSMTAANADEWLRNAPGTEGVLALAMLQVILEEGRHAKEADAGALRAAVKGVDVAKAAEISGVPAETIKRIAHDFAQAKGALAIGGGVAMTGSQATDTLIAVNLLNSAVGAVGKTIRFGADAALGKTGSYADMAKLTQAMAAGEIDVLVLADVNPVYNMPAKSGFGEALAKVGLVVSLASHPTETTAKATVVLPALHSLESWGDYAARDGVIGLMQPTMGPVTMDGKPVDGKSTGDILLLLGRRALGTEEGKGSLKWGSFEEYVREQWQGLARQHGGGKTFADFWEESLRRGGVWGAPATAAMGKANIGRLTGGPAKLEGDGTHALLLYPSARFYDGRSADKPWLQEAPDVMTQVAWDGWVEVPVETADKLGLGRGDMVKLTSPHGSIELPAWPSKTLHPGAVAVAMGLGHDFPGAFANGGRIRTNTEHDVFLNGGASPLRLLPAAPEAASGGLPHLAVKVSLARTGARRPLAIPQATFDDENREIAEIVGLAAAREMELRGKSPEGASLPSMYPPVKYPDYRWGMAVDVDACTGCQACVVACSAENNVPVVGKAQVAYGRAQQWIRLERWEKGQGGKTNVFLPMFCQHCAVAPCEPVCPVYAAYHTAEGLNAQVYNRCVGTRYCGNNCPYHVRRFNWFNYTWTAPLDQQLNPDVTVRQLGVMEKCTMCIQRIEKGKNDAREAGRAVKDGDIQTACQQTCPTQAISFGNLKEGATRVAKLSVSPRSYHVLQELGTRPAVTYLAKVVRGETGGHGTEKGHKA
ncbi:MAG TPA: molybdopterin-dependent oxidoreductase [Methylomirabilota bacterium]|nr:molybdopterin-dependent oxidoreductase [Methylomirabilota bacterium]